METRKKVQPIEIDFKCPKCENGYLRPTGQVLTSYPPIYPHTCNDDNCNYGESFTDMTYPQIVWEEINE